MFRGAATITFKIKRLSVTEHLTRLDMHRYYDVNSVTARWNGVGQEEMTGIRLDDGHVGLLRVVRWCMCPLLPLVSDLLHSYSFYLSLSIY